MSCPQRRMVRADSYGVYYILKAWSKVRPLRHRAEIPHQVCHYRILARPRSRFTHYYFYIRDETLGPMVMRVASFLPFQTTHHPDGHNAPSSRKSTEPRSASARSTPPSRGG